MATITQTVEFSCSPERVFDTLVDAKHHAAFTGESAIIDPRVGGEFAVYGNYATGTFTEFTPNHSYTQLWRASDWDEDQVSTVTITLTPTAQGCTLTLIQNDVPDSEEPAIAAGWQDWYWKPLGEYLARLA